MTRKLGSFVVAAGLTVVAASAHALVIPVGPQNDININTVTNTWGWTLCDTRFYSAHNDGGFASLNPACSGFTHIMLAGRQTGNVILDVLAATTLVDATTDTGAANNGVTTTSNGSEWYYSTNWSWGFAGLGDAVQKNSCDVAGIPERDRLCYHTQLAAGGYRSGDNISLNNSTAFEKLVFVAIIPEPATITFFGIGLAGLGVISRRRR